VRRTAAALLGLALFGPGCGGGGSSSQKLEDMQFSAFVGGDTGGDPVTVKLSDYFASSQPDTRIIMISAAAGWCVPCMNEAAAMDDFAATYQPQGVAILTAVFQDNDANPADPAFVKAWVDAFSLTIPALIDSDFQTSAYFDVSAMPSTVFADAETLDILKITTGAAPGDDPMKDYRDLLDYYLQ
jgi:thiol-disulfide isomerase/thioredoxin